MTHISELTAQEINIEIAQLLGWEVTCHPCFNRLTGGFVDGHYYALDTPKNAPRCCRQWVGEYQYEEFVRCGIVPATCWAGVPDFYGDIACAMWAMEQLVDSWEYCKFNFSHSHYHGYHAEFSLGGNSNFLIEPKDSWSMYLRPESCTEASSTIATVVLAGLRERQKCPQN